MKAGQGYKSLVGRLRRQVDNIKVAKMTKTSQATALRDITDLIDKGILVAAEEGGRSTNYMLNDE